ncbi:hypothetical protein [Antarcticimicrobium sediminis]|uniref:hypothetical protein n=1 Tax=Antarcticimicrobium sediminis TaxID=2546227 RepID=UPI001404A1B1|nr:hypothetical protein [Antarcticimicrobium sediminis]
MMICHGFPFGKFATAKGLAESLLIIAPFRRIFWQAVRGEDPAQPPVLTLRAAGSQLCHIQPITDWFQAKYRMELS